jgi:hypothetical protein
MAASILAVVSGCEPERPPNKVLKFAPALRASAGRAKSARRLARRYRAFGHFSESVLV